MSRESILRAFRSAGLFAAARRATSGRLRILCYHGLSYEDEHLRHPKLFMSKAAFAQRMQILERLGASVMPLSEAVARLGTRSMPELPVVLTFDDGWRSVLDIGSPILQQMGFPATVYVTTSEMEARAPASNIVVESLFSHAKPRTVDLATFDRSLSGHFDLAVPAERVRACDTIISAMVRRFPPAERGEWVTRCGEWLGCAHLVSRYNALYRMATFEDLANLGRSPDNVIDLQLHTHTHRLTRKDRDELREEIARNRELLRSVATSELRHFCYPSGIFRETMFPWLRELGIESAATCEPGLNRAGANPLRLRRYLDGEHLSALNFEAEVCGFLELMRNARGSLRGRAA